MRQVDRVAPQVVDEFLFADHACDNGARADSDTQLQARGRLEGVVLGKPLGVGILSAALKKDAVDASGYAKMIATTTQLNTPGPELAALPGVHAMTDVTGFGLAGHALELARAAQCSLNIEWSRVPLIDGVLKLAADGMVTGASGRNFTSYGHDIALPADFAPAARALLTDPQTSGGLLVSCAEDSVAAVLQTFREHGFASAAEIGAVAPRREALLTIL